MYRIPQWISAFGVLVRKKFEVRRESDDSLFVKFDAEQNKVIFGDTTTLETESGDPIGGGGGGPVTNLAVGELLTVGDDTLIEGTPDWTDIISDPGIRFDPASGVFTLLFYDAEGEDGPRRNFFSLGDDSWFAATEKVTLQAGFFSNEPGQRLGNFVLNKEIGFLGVLLVDDTQGDHASGQVKILSWDNDFLGSSHLRIAALEAARPPTGVTSITVLELPVCEDFGVPVVAIKARQPVEFVKTEIIDSLSVQQVQQPVITDASAYTPGGGKTYSYKIVALGESGHTEASAEATATDCADDLSAFEALNQIYWHKVPGALNGYDIYRTATDATITNTTGLIAHVDRHARFFNDEGQAGDSAIPPSDNTTGIIKYGDVAAIGAEELSGYIMIKDWDGNPVKLAVVA